MARLFLIKANNHLITEFQAYPIMTIKKLIPLFFVLTLIACKKHKTTPLNLETRVINFTTTSYQALGTFDSLGTPDYLLTKESISSSLLSFIDNTLPNGVDLRNRNPKLLNTSAILNITQPSDVYVTFVSQGSGYSNTLAFYTYPTNTAPTSSDDIKTITYIFPNSGTLTTLVPGDKVKIGRFDAGISIGFVLLENSWINAKGTINNSAVHFCSNDVLNPEVDTRLQKHAVLFNYSPENKILIGFEDVDRTKPECDHDFNDVVFYCTVTP